MLLSFKWIKDFVDIDENPYKVADALTMSGIEVEEVVHVSIPGEVVCVRVVDVMPHPNADRLSIALVDTGREKLDIVCGAPNVRPGMLSALAPPGVVLADGMKVKRAKIRGVESPGILVSERELGLTDDHTGIMEGIPDGIRPGESLVQAMDLEDWVFNINVTPNRGDCLSVIGIARELSTMFGTEMTWPSMELKETGA
ncbi:MAG: phenylalanine--tRNA ligase subunit beta, partial [Deltaproteobacteria bacterium]